MSAILLKIIDFLWIQLNKQSKILVIIFDSCIKIFHRKFVWSKKNYIHCFSPLSFHSIFVFHRSWVAIYFRLSSILKFNIIFVTQYDSKCVRTSRDWPTYAEKFKVFGKKATCSRKWFLEQPSNSHTITSF